MTVAQGCGAVLLLLLPGCAKTQTGTESQPPRATLPTGSGAETQSRQDTSHPPLLLDLRDGSRLTGIPLISSLPLKTAYTTIDAPLKKIRSIRISDEGNTATVEFLNGDVLHGDIQIESLPLRTLLGKLDVPLTALRQVAWPGVILDDALVAYYPLDGSPRDVSGHKNDGTNHGAVPGIDRYGRDGGAYAFNGDGAYIGLPNGLEDPAGGGFTWSFWALCRERGGERRFLLYGGANTAESGTEFNGGKLSFGVHLENDQGFSASVNIPLDAYVHLACVYRRGAYVQIWVNGILESQVSVTDGVLMHGSNQHSAAIGSYAPEQPNHMRAYHIKTWLGLVDEVRIYSRPLDRSEIELLAADH